MPKIVDKEARRFEIGVAAGALFGERGIDNVTMEEVAVAAGVGKGTLYEYFKSKDELIHGAFNALMDHMVEGFAQLASPDLPPLEALRALSIGFVEALEHFGTQYGFFLEYMLFINRTNYTSNALLEMMQGFREMVGGILAAGQVEGVVRKDINTEHAAAAFISWFDGVIFHYMLLPTPNMTQMATAYVDMTVRGLAAPGGDA